MRVDDERESLDVQRFGGLDEKFTEVETQFDWLRQIMNERNERKRVQLESLEEMLLKHLSEDLRTTTRLQVEVEQLRQEVGSGEPE
jgi:hypothetical protein